MFRDEEEIKESNFFEQMVDRIADIDIKLDNINEVLTPMIENSLQNYHNIISVSQ